jgi:hypothetical protein
MSVKTVITGLAFSLIITQPVLATEPEPVPATPDDKDSATAQPAGDVDLEQRIRAYRELYDERQLEQKKRHEEMLERYAERQKARAERFDAMLKQREARQAEIIKRQTEMRDRYTGERDYLSEHHLELLDMALKRKEKRIKRHEDVRRQAEERQAEFARYRSEMEGLSPEEMNAYMDERITEMSKERQQHQRAYQHPQRKPRMAGSRWQPPPPPRYPGPPAGR